MSSEEDDISEVIYVDGDDTRTVQPSGRSRPLLTVVVPGPQGPAGVSNIPGEDGEDSWVPGPPGSAGPTGAVGGQGVPGPPGWQGDDGDDGWAGPQGPPASTIPLANFSAVLPTTYLTPNFATLLFSAPAVNAGGYWSNTAARWAPPAAPVVLACSLVISCYNFAAVTLVVGIFKDDVQIATSTAVVQGDGSLGAATVTVVDVTTGASVYEVRALVVGLQSGGLAQTQFIGTVFSGTISPPVVGPPGSAGNPGVNGANGTPGAAGAAGMTVIGPPGEDADDFGWPIPGSPGPAGTIPSDVALLDVADQTISGGANVTAYNIGTKSSGTYTIDCGKRPLQYLTNGGSFTLAAPSADGSCLIMVTNNGSAGTISFSSFSVGALVGDTIDTVNGHIFTISVWRINGVCGYRVAAHQ